MAHLKIFEFWRHQKSDPELHDSTTENDLRRLEGARRTSRRILQRKVRPRLPVAPISGRHLVRLEPRRRYNR